MAEILPEASSNSMQLRQILQSSRRIAIVGMSAEWHRPSYFVGKYLLEHGYEVFPVNPRYQSILGKPCVGSLLDLPGPVDLVDCFRRSEEILPIAEAAISIGAKCLWQQLGVRNMAADHLIRSKGLESVMDRCVKIEHGRLFGGLNWVGVNTGVVSAHRPRQLPY